MRRESLPPKRPELAPIPGAVIVGFVLVASFIFLAMLGAVLFTVRCAWEAVAQW